MRRLLVTLAALAVTSACTHAPTNYSEQSREVFTRSCVGAGGDNIEDICACAYDRITNQISYAEFKAFDEQLAADPDALPDELATIVTDCAAEQTAGTTTTTG